MRWGLKRLIFLMKRRFNENENVIPAERIIIKPFKSISYENMDIEGYSNKMFFKIQDAINKICDGDLNLNFEDLYKSVQHLCLLKKEKVLYEKLIKSLSGNLEKVLSSLKQ
jgi:hypothetical protein